MLTVPQPWAWAIAQGHQQLYTHREEILRRGELLILARGREPDFHGYRWLREQGYEVPDLADLWRGHLVGSVDLVECLPVASTRLPRNLAQWSGESGFNLLFKNAVAATNPVPAAGGAKLVQPPGGWGRAFMAESAVS